MEASKIMEWLRAEYELFRSENGDRKTALTFIEWMEAKIN